MFKVKSIAVAPPVTAAAQPLLTPELLASVLAKYSRSNDGLDAILSKVDLANPEASIERILKFVDYGHASIGGLTGGIAIAIDGVTMWLAYKLFEFAPYADGQESSTRYIPMDESSLPDWGALGFQSKEAEAIDALAKEGLKYYLQEKERLDKRLEQNPASVRYPDGATEKVKARIRVNYGLDRARYFLPFAMKTNVALVQTARAWCDTISALLSMPQPEAQALGEALKKQLEKFAPNLAKHARRKPGYVDYHAALERNVHGSERPQHRFVELFSYPGHPDNIPFKRLELRENRYDMCHPDICASTVRVSWGRMAVAEVRDLNRHRTGHRSSTLCHRGFYLPSEVWDSSEHRQYRDFEKRLLKIHSHNINNSVTRPYTLFLGSQTDFTHTMQLDKFIYEAELRTGPGAHFRYAEHLRDAVCELIKVAPGLSYNLKLGDAEPE